MHGLLHHEQSTSSQDWPGSEVVGWLASVCPNESSEKIASALQVVDITRQLGMDQTGLVVSFLLSFDLFSASVIASMGENFGVEVAELYRSAKRMQELSSLLSVEPAHRLDEKENEENLRKMLIAMVDDVRVVQICLAGQLNILRSARYATAEYQKFQAKLARDVYAPLANRLGIWQLKWEMEDYSFRYMHPHAYKTLADALEEKRHAREQYIARRESEISRILNHAGIEADVQGRPKHIYSIWKKMQRKNLEFTQLWDLRGMRILVRSVEDCYSVLSAIHTTWKHIPREFSDYIAMPKANGYQSIHTVVIGPEMKSLEVQIRTYSMHRESELGMAAHWRYKENVGQENSIDQKVLWLRHLLAWKNEVLGAERGGDRIDGSETALATAADADREQRVYVFTPKGTIVDLPIGSTPIDFAYAIHTDVGHRTRGAKVNGKMAPLNHRLQTGDQVHIQTVKSGGPSRDWLRNHPGNIKTSRARSRIMQWFKHADYDQRVSEGRGMLERELRRLGLEDLSHEKINQHTHFQKVDDLLAAIGANDYKLSKALYPFKPAAGEELESMVVQTRRPGTKRKKDRFSVHDMGNLLTRMAKCCQPVPRDEIIGFITTGRGVSIHRSHCINILNLDEALANRLIDVEWGDHADSSYSLGLWILAYHRSGLLHEVTEALKSSNVDVLKVNMETDQEHVTRLQFYLEIPESVRPEQLIGRLSSIQNVFEVKRAV